MGLHREVEPFYHRPKIRRLVNLSNDELALLFSMRAEKITKALTGHIWWDSVKSVYWNEFIPLLARLYETMAEIQARYPTCEMQKYKYEGLIQIDPMPTENGFIDRLANGLKEL